jgi:molybdopterin-guanine dinucleotide biosynthesis protein A
VGKWKACGCIMAGGASTRMGRNKALIEFQGQPLIERTVGRFKDWFDQVLLVTNTPEEYGFLGVEMVSDRLPDLGPLAGIEAGLVASRHPLLFVAACDMPFLDEALIKHLISLANGVDVVLPVIAGQSEPLHAVYARTCLPYVTANLNEGALKLGGLMAQLQVRQVAEAEVAPFGAPDRLFMNCNSPNDLTLALSLAAGHPRSPRQIEPDK